MKKNYCVLSLLLLCAYALQLFSMDVAKVASNLAAFNGQLTALKGMIDKLPKKPATSLTFYVDVPKDFKDLIDRIYRDNNAGEGPMAPILVNKIAIANFKNLNDVDAESVINLFNALFASSNDSLKDAGIRIDTIRAADGQLNTSIRLYSAIDPWTYAALKLILAESDAKALKDQRNNILFQNGNWTTNILNDTTLTAGVLNNIAQGYEISPKQRYALVRVERVDQNGRETVIYPKP